MSLISKPYTFSTGAVIVAAEHNSNFDTIYNSYNGDITNVNIAAGAGIVDTKLAQITTAGKVAGDALTSLANVPAGAGYLPLANTPISYKLSSTTRDLSTASGTQAITGVGFAPRAIFFLCGVNNNVQNSIGVDDGTTKANLVGIDSETASRWLINTSASITLRNNSSDYNTAYVTALGADGFTLTWTKTGSPTGTATIIYLALR